MTDATTEDPPVLDEAVRPPGATRPAASRARRTAVFWLARPGLVLSVALVGLVLLAAFFPALFTSRDPLAGVPPEKLQPPGSAHLFGTDQLGRDLFARVVHGCALTLRATTLAVAVGLVAGSLIGLLAGYLGGRADSVLMRLTDVLLAVPGLLLSLALVTALGFGTVQVAVAVGVTSVGMFARIMRAEVLRIAGTAYVEAARAGGCRWYTVLARHVLPNAAAPVLVYAAVDFGGVVLQVSSLSFLGYGARPRSPNGARWSPGAATTSTRPGG